MIDEILPEPYPGSTASVWQIEELALAYYQGAIVLCKNAESLEGHTLATIHYAPVRLCAIHAIELFLNAYLKHEGVPVEKIRGRMHNLADPEFVSHLNIKKKTAEHLKMMSERREYLISRYAPDMMSKHSEISRLLTTLKEIMTKVCGYLRLSSAAKFTKIETQRNDMLS